MKNSKCCKKVILCLLSFFVVSQVQAQAVTVVTNGGLDGSLGFPQVPDGWTGNGGAIYQDLSPYGTGARTLSGSTSGGMFFGGTGVYLDGVSPGGHTYIEQTISVASAGVFSLSFEQSNLGGYSLVDGAPFLNHWITNGDGAWQVLIDGMVVGQGDTMTGFESQGDPGDLYNTWSATSVDLGHLSAGDHSLRIRVLATTEGDGQTPGASLGIDNIRLIPEPSSSMLIGLGCVCMLLRRQRMSCDDC